MARKNEKSQKTKANVLEAGKRKIKATDYPRK
jgi:hypothetical protein